MLLFCLSYLFTGNAEATSESDIEKQEIFQNVDVDVGEGVIINIEKQTLIPPDKEVAPATREKKVKILVHIAETEAISNIGKFPDLNDKFTFKLPEIYKMQQKYMIAYGLRRLCDLEVITNNNFSSENRTGIGLTSNEVPYYMIAYGLRSTIKGESPNYYVTQFSFKYEIPKYAIAYGLRN